MTKSTKNFALPLAFIGIMFFAIGFALGINSFLIPVLQGSLGITSAESYLIIAATFVPFLIFGYPASMTIKKIGYKRTMSLSFLMFAVAFGLFIPSASYESFHLFLFAAFVSGTANAFLQASVNPYITILGPIDSAAKRISIMGICNKLAWPVAPAFLAFLIGKSMNDTVISDLFLPFYVIIAVFIVLGLISLMAPLPEVKAAGEDGNDEENACPYAAKKTSVWQFPHLLLGCLALFLYVGVETVSLGTLVDYAASLGLPNPEIYASVSPIGIVIGYICGIIFIPKYISQATALKICSVIAIVGSLLVVITPADISIYFLALLALGCSLMWPALWPLAMADLGKFTKAGSSLLIMAMAGGAVIPTLFGYFKDIAGAQNAYWVCLPCFVFILYYGIAGYKIRTK
ncbi:glucose/galactose MFS transporter [Bacteroides sp.]|uniref:glucose/galactose MFS transporter n=1 Tax=Bacteroides sp. TaxID=29523 RepID=UPI001B67F2B7|nr:glucose/galactose MFS transporter [Bacteroides sp.]MBP6065871.1 glucose/galactose MFS transporter [Bacteroides sp.]MBP6067924.1 glucose/galactose MFS transporter [Bacteroides sp.]MBP6937216.1 glucose/galactose MFS transporter [Bacteroides sp.]MBP8622772.1 glucose/galactose MFS transporter [Bacteroides sp.]MBP9507525.1 glucose/galactose MFS transporter [Bacteroides sp.]